MVAQPVFRIDWRRVAAACGLLLAVLAAASVGFALEIRPDDAGGYRGWALSGCELRAAADTDRAPDVERTVSTLLSTLRGGLALQGRRGLFGRACPPFGRDLLAADIRRIRLHLARNGFPWAETRALIEPDDEARRLHLTLEVTPGAAVRIGEIRLTGLPFAAAELDSVTAAHESGAVFTETAMQAIGASLAELARGRGYASVELSSSASLLDSTSVRLEYAFAAGVRYTFTSAEIGGVADDLRDLAADRLAFIRGRSYDPALVRRAQRDLRDLQLFRKINLNTKPAAADSLVLVADLAARKPQHTAASVGTWADHPIRVKASWRHRNLFRRGRGFLIRGAWSPRQYDAATSAWWPGLLRPDARVSLTLGFEAEREESYHQDTASTELALRLSPWRPWRELWRFGVGFSRVRVDDRTPAEDVFDAGAGRLLTLSAEFRRDRSDHPLEPRAGYRLRLETAWSPPGALSDYPYVMASGQATAYRTWRAVTFAGRLHGAAVTPRGDATRLLPGVRLFAGGGGTMRGYHRRELGPVDASGDPLGGRLRLLAGAELRCDLPGPFGVALFADAGQVWARADEFDTGDMALAAGPGLTISTPIGAVRGDFAFNLRKPDTADGDRVEPPGWVFHFSIGHPW